ncbi:hypothetical protein Pst134EB_016963 [Puccinia striiformis f. sp. tritici]|nr:hypothetical protein Pst134EB_016963 [Puccinia striiformis f. sp. tritici]
MASQYPDLALQETWQSVLMATANKAISGKLPKLVETHTERLTSIIFDHLIQSKLDTMCIFCFGSAICIVNKLYQSRKLALAEQQKADMEARFDSKGTPAKSLNILPN